MCIFPNAKFRQIKLSISTSTTSCWFTMQGIFFVCFPFKFEAKSVYKLKASQNKIHFFIMLYVTSDDKAFWHRSEVYFWYSEGTPFKTWKVGIFISECFKSRFSVKTWALIVRLTLIICELISRMTQCCAVMFMCLWSKKECYLVDVARDWNPVLSHCGSSGNVEALSALF